MSQIQGFREFMHQKKKIKSRKYNQTNKQTNIYLCEDRFYPAFYMTRDNRN